MADLSPTIVDQVLAACQQGSSEAAEAFGRALDTKLSIAVGQPATLDAKSLPQAIAGPGLVIVLTVGNTGALVLIAESTGLLPPWCADPDPTGQSKLSTLAQELGMLLLPEALMPEGFKASWVKNLPGAVARGGLAEDAAMVPLELTSTDGRKGTAALVWPTSKPAAVLGAGGATTAAKAPPPASDAPQAAAGAPKAAPSAPRPVPGVRPAAPLATPVPMRRSVTPSDLPGYSRSLLRIRLPVVVTLAQNKQPLWRVLELGPGSIIHFDKPCDGMLDLEVSNRPIAAGEAVKVGDKFGLRVTSIVLPDERFKPVDPRRPNRPA